MKNPLFGLLLIAALILGGCGSKPTVSESAVSGSDELDTAIREASNYLNSNIPKGSKIVILNIQSGSSALSDYIIDELIAHAVNDRVFSVVDRQQLNLLRTELDFQYSGDVDDDSAQAIGKMTGAQTIVSGAVSQYGETYRIRIRALEVQTAQVQGQFNRNIPKSSTLEALINSQSTDYSTGGSGSGSRAASAQGTARAIIPQGTNLTQQLAWIADQGGDGTVYDIIVNNDISLRATTISTRGRNITINLHSASQSPRTIELTGQGHLLEVETNITLKLQDLILKGHNNNNVALVLISSGGTMILNSGSKVSGNTNTSNTARGGGIRVDGGVLELHEGAEISGNTVRGGSSSDPHSDNFGAWDGQGGGIYAGSRSTITIRGGLISGNKSDTKGGARGGGIFVIGGSTVSMTGGTISRNSCAVGYSGYRLGGGVLVYDAASSFTKKAAPGSDTSGIIYGSTGSNANTAPDGGHAIFREFANPHQRNSTLGYYDEISTSSNDGWGMGIG